MSTRLFGVLVDGLNKPIVNATVTLLAKGNTLTVLTGSEAIFRTDNAGAYNITVQAGHYNVYVGPQGLEPYKAGEIVIYADSPEGSLNGYLIQWAPEELTPDVVKQVQQLVANSEEYALQSGRAAAAANLDATDARESKAAAQSAANSALTYKNDAAGSADEAKKAQQGASGSANTANQAVTIIQGIQADVTVSKQAAAVSAANAKTSETNASQHAQTATEKAGVSTEAATRSEKAAQDATTILSQSLKKDQNLADLANKDTAKQNLQLDRFKQSADETMIYPSSEANPYRITIRPNGEWGTWRDDTGVWEALKVEAGGTGAKDVQGAKVNFGLGSFNTIHGQESRMYWPQNNNRYIYINDGGTWGCYDVELDGGKSIPLGLGSGGTGATNEKDSRLNIGTPSAYKTIPDGTNILGWFIENGEPGFFSCGENVINKPADGHGWWTFEFRVKSMGSNGKPTHGVVVAVSAANLMYIITLDNGNWPHGWYKIIRENDNVQLRDLKLTQYDTGFSGHLQMYNIQGNNPKGLTLFYNEFQDGVFKTTLRSSNQENGKGAHLQWDEDGSLWNVVNMLNSDLYFGPHSVRKLHTRHGTMLVDGTATPYYYTFGNPDGRRSVTEFGTREDGWIFYGQVNKDLSKQLDVNGVVNATVLNQTSDRDLKENIEVIDNAIERIRKIGGYTYTLKENGMPYAGVIAQEVRIVLPEASGSVTKYTNLEGPTEDGSTLRGEERFYSVDYGAITALLVQACKEMDEKITKLEDENKTLKESLISIEDIKKDIAELKRTII